MDFNHKTLLLAAVVGWISFALGFAACAVLSSAKRYDEETGD